MPTAVQLISQLQGRSEPEVFSATHRSTQETIQVVTVENDLTTRYLLKRFLNISSNVNTISRYVHAQLKERYNSDTRSDIYYLMYPMGRINN